MSDRVLVKRICLEAVSKPVLTKGRLGLTGTQAQLGSVSPSHPTWVLKCLLVLAAALFVLGCSSSSKPIGSPISQVEQTSSQKQITFFVAGMNKRLKIL